MTFDELAAVLHRAQHAVDDDEPDFAGPLAQVAETVLPRLRDGGEHARALRPGLGALFVAVRKLRPCPIWVEGPAAAAIVARDAYALDGVLVRGAAEDVPQGRGREAYWVVAAEDETALWSQVPAGFGVVIAAPDPAMLPPTRITEARKVLRGRSLGVLTPAQHAHGFRGAGFDLVLLDQPAAGEADGLSELAPRLMCRALGVVRTSSTGVIVPVAAAAETALYLAGYRHGGSHGRSR